MGAGRLRRVFSLGDPLVADLFNPRGGISLLRAYGQRLACVCRERPSASWRVSTVSLSKPLTGSAGFPQPVGPVAHHLVHRYFGTVWQVNRVTRHAHHAVDEPRQRVVLELALGVLGVEAPFPESVPELLVATQCQFWKQKTTDTQTSLPRLKSQVGGQNGLDLSQLHSLAMVHDGQSQSQSLPILWRGDWPPPTVLVAARRRHCVCSGLIQGVVSAGPVHSAAGMESPSIPD